MAWLPLRQGSAFPSPEDARAEVADAERRSGRQVGRPEVALPDLVQGRLERQVRHEDHGREDAVAVRTVQGQEMVDLAQHIGRLSSHVDGQVLGDDPAEI
jgi:hypothetical protein